MKTTTPTAVPTMKIRNLVHADLNLLGTWDNAKRWYPVPAIADYFKHLRPPSRDYNLSYYKAAKAAKFGRWLVINCPDIAKRFQIG